MSDAMLGRIGDAYSDEALTAIPARLTAFAEQAFGWRLRDAELAQILFDSASDELVGVRGTTTERRSFRYGSGEFVIRVHLTDTSLIVMIEPPLSAPCRVSTIDGSIDHRTDALGELAVDTPELPVRLELDLPDGTVATPWIMG